MSMDERQRSIDAFQQHPRVKVFIGQIRAAGVGITLTAASTVQFVELAWTPGEMSQCEDRAHRIGQTNAVLVEHLVFDGSLDSKMAKTLVQKQEWADAALDSGTAINVEELTLPTVPSAGKSRKPHPRKYPVPSDEQRQAAGEAMISLRLACDGALKEDGMGFSKVDTRTGWSLAATAQAGPLTDGQTWLATKLARTYRRQLSDRYWEILDLAPKPKKRPAPAKSTDPADEMPF